MEEEYTADRINRTSYIIVRVNAHHGALVA
jgi:hypothetical protein